MFNRLFSKIQFTNSCWVWTASKTQNGYGLIRKGRANEGLLLAHRASYELFIGEIPEGMVLDHICRNRSCVNPDHLEIVTQAENVLRQASAITHCPKGHSYSDSYKYKNSRRCRTCALEYATKQRNLRKGLGYAI